MILLTGGTRNGLVDGERALSHVTPWDPSRRVIVCDGVNAPKKSHYAPRFARP